MNRTAITLFLATLTTSLLANEVTFTAIGKPSALRILGTCTGKLLKKDKFKATSGMSGIEISAEVVLDTCDTGIELRNRHMKEKYLETAKFPKAELSGFLMDGSTDFNGRLTVHGKTVEVKGEHFDGSLRFKTRISDHGIGVPSFLGVTVADEVHIEAQMAR